MSEEYVIKQSTGKNATGDNIGVQNNIYGISPEEAIKITNKLFIDNFPKLQEQAMATVNQRFDEFQETLFRKLSENPNINYGVFAEPDMQYVLYEAEMNYARYGTEELLETLSSLLQKRIEFSNQDYIKIVIDSAIKIVGQLTQQQIDLLTLTFLTKVVKFGRVKTLNDLERVYNYISSIVTVENNGGFSMLLSCGCLQLGLDSVQQRAANSYGFKKEEVAKILPKSFRFVPPDYDTSDIGNAIAIINAQNKGIELNLSFEMFIK